MQVRHVLYVYKISRDAQVAERTQQHERRELLVARVTPVAVTPISQSHSESGRLSQERNSYSLVYEFSWLVQNYL